MSENGRRYDTSEFDMTRDHPPKAGRRPPIFGERTVPRWVYRIALILFLCILGTLGWMNRENLTPANVLEWVQTKVVGMGMGDGYPHSIAGTSVQPQNFLAVDKNLCFASDTSLTLLNSTAKELVSRQHSFSDPVLRFNGNRMLLYNLGGRGYQLEGFNQTFQKASLSQNIISGALDRQGGYALLTEAEGYCGELTAYTSDGREQSHYWFSDYYPTAIALNPKGNMAAVTGVNVANGAVKSVIYLLNLNSTKTQQPFAVYEGNLLFAVSWDGDNSVTAFGDRAAEFLDVGRRSKAEFSYAGKRLTAYSSSDGLAAVGLLPYEGSANSSLVLLSHSGQEILSPSLQGTIRSVSAFGSAVAALCGPKVYFYTSSPAGSAGNRDAGSDAKAVAIRDETSAYVLGVSEVRMVSDR